MDARLIDLDFSDMLSLESDSRSETEFSKIPAVVIDRGNKIVYSMDGSGLQKTFKNEIYPRFQEASQNAGLIPLTINFMTRFSDSWVKEDIGIKVESKRLSNYAEGSAPPLANKAEVQAEAEKLKNDPKAEKKGNEDKSEESFLSQVVVPIATMLGVYAGVVVGALAYANVLEKKSTHDFDYGDIGNDSIVLFMKRYKPGIKNKDNRVMSITAFFIDKSSMNEVINYRPTNGKRDRPHLKIIEKELATFKYNMDRGVENMNLDISLESLLESPIDDYTSYLSYESVKPVKDEDLDEEMDKKSEEDLDAESQMQATETFIYTANLLDEHYTALGREADASNGKQNVFIRAMKKVVEHFAYYIMRIHNFFMRMGAEKRIKTLEAVSSETKESIKKDINDQNSSLYKHLEGSYKNKRFYDLKRMNEIIIESGPLGEGYAGAIVSAVEEVEEQLLKKVEDRIQGGLTSKSKLWVDNVEGIKKTEKTAKEFLEKWSNGEATFSVEVLGVITNLAKLAGKANNLIVKFITMGVGAAKNYDNAPASSGDLDRKTSRPFYSGALKELMVYVRELNKMSTSWLSGLIFVDRVVKSYSGKKE